MKYRKKPVVIEAIQFTGQNYDECLDFMSGRANAATSRLGTISIGTLEGVMEATPGDWIIKGVNGEFYPCKPDIFAKTYESADTPPRQLIDPNDHEALCEAVIRQTEIAGCECFEKNYAKDGAILASVLCFVGSHAAEMTAMVREQLNHFGFHRGNTP